MKTIIVSNIFGLTPHLQLLANTLSPDHEILDPYKGRMRGFKSEPVAYQEFLMSCGMTNYTDRVTNKIRHIKEKICLLGFSAGAAAVWNTLGEDDTLGIEKAVCFYGSRIRANTGLMPCCNTVLVFPREEAHFSVAELSRLLAKTPNVQCINTEFYHGFMNKCSDNFDHEGYRQYLGWLKKSLPVQPKY